MSAPLLDKSLITDFPILSREVYGKKLVYLDNAATTQKPRCVVDAIADEYTDWMDRPFEPQVMETVTVETFGQTYPEPTKA